MAGLVFIALGLLTGCPRRPQIKEVAPEAIGPAVPSRAMTATPEVPKPSLPPEEAEGAKVAGPEGRVVGGETPPERAVVPGEEVTGPRAGLPSVPSAAAPGAPPREAPETEGKVRTPEVIVGRPVEEQRPEEQPGIREEEMPTFPKAREETLPLGAPRIGEQELKGPAGGPEAQVPGVAPARPVEEARRGGESGVGAESPPVGLPEARAEEPRIGEQELKGPAGGPEAQVPGVAPARPVEEARRGGESGVGAESPPVGLPEARAEGLQAPVTKPDLAEEEGKAPEVSAPSPEGMPGPSPPAEKAFPPPPLMTGKEEKEILPEAPSEAAAMAKIPEVPPSEERESAPTRQSPVGVPPGSPEAAVGQEGYAPAPSEGVAPGQGLVPSTGEEARTPPPVAAEPGAPKPSQALARVVEPPGVPEPPPPQVGYPEFAPPVYAPEVPKAPEPVLKAEVQALLPEASVAAIAPPPTAAGERPLQDIFFDFNESLIRGTDRVILDQNAAWLRAHPEVRIIIEGHCDERGTNEYNLALGERRARAAKEYLVAAGIDPGRIVTVSYGEERPFVLGHDEDAWRWNRRAHFVILAP